MDGLRAFKRIFAFLLAQAGLLLAGMIFHALELVRQAPASLPVITEMLFGALTLMILRLAWPMASSGIELFWGTSVKLLVKRWMHPSLTIGAIACLVCAAVLAIEGGSEVALAVAQTIAVGAFLVPFAISCALLISAIRRLKAYRNGIGMMTANAGSAAGLQRAKASISSELGESETTVRPNPQGFTFAGLTSKPWHDAADFDWVAGFENSVDAITEEFERVNARYREGIRKYKYAGLDGGHWKSFQFVTRHRELTENAELCPITTRLLKTIPHYPSFRDAMFSILDGGGVIRPHRDVSNVFLTMHLPLIVPGNGFMEVAGLRKEWRKGEAMIFDSSYHHQAQNNADSPRVVLLVDFLHPELTEKEAAWVTASRL